MKDPDYVTITDVTANNVEQLTPFIFEELESADFIAIDQELSGLGNTAGRGRLDMTSYYTRLRETAETRQVVSIGLSCFQSSRNFTKSHPDSCDPLAFTCTSFNILLFPDGEFEMDGSAKRFLVTHGFDLNRWVDAGIRYSLHGLHNDFMSSLVRKLVTTKAMLVFHNGLTDLAFFYNSFYIPLPKNNESFTADIADMFGDRLFDTKVICNKVLGWRLHALEYCYKKAQRVTERSNFNGKPAVILQMKELPAAPSDLITIPTSVRRMEFREAPKIGLDVCELVYHFGFCNSFKTGACKHSVEQHQMDLVLDVEEQKNVIEVVDDALAAQNSIPALQNSATGLFRETNDQDRQESDNFRESLFRPPTKSVNPENKTNESPVSTDGPRNSLYNFVPKAQASEKQPQQPLHPQRLGTSHFSIDTGKTYNIDFGLHNAGFDAFMTGYVFALCLAQLGRRSDQNGRVIFANCESFVGRVHVTGKTESYCFSKSAHVKVSAKHAQKIARIRDKTISKTEYAEESVAK